MAENSERGLSVVERFTILERDGFTCLYCGARPGNERLNVDHFLPWSRGGTSDPDNLGTACDRCNNGKRDLISVPARLCEDPSPDRAGYRLWKTFGPWRLEWCHDFMLINLPSSPEKPGEYWFDLPRAHELDWVEHIGRKRWGTPEVLAGLDAACVFGSRICRQLSEDEREKWRRF